MDPELEAFIPLFPQVDHGDVAAARRLYADLAASKPSADVPGMTVEEGMVPGEVDVPIRLYRPPHSRGAVIWLHGGGWMMGDLDTERPFATRVAESSGAMVVSVDYRLAPEHPYPAALDDIYAVLNWTAEQAHELGIDPERIAIGGHSSGGNLAAGVALRARDERGPRLCFQLLNEAALDDREETWSRQNFTDTPWATRDNVAFNWRTYLGPSGATPYAAPMRADDLSGLPPAYIASAEFCPNRDEDIAYAVRLLQAGVSVELKQWAGTFHGSQAILSADVSQRQIAEIGAALRRALTT